MKFLFACLAIACTLLGFGLFGLAVWGIATVCELFFALFPMVGVILACIVFFGWIGWMIWFCCKVIWMFAKSIFEVLCEKYDKK